MARWITAAALLAAAACGGGGAAPGGGGPVEPQAPAFTSLAVSPATGSVEVGGTFQLTATPMDGAGSPMSALPAAGWQSSDGARAQVDASGKVTGISLGSVTVTATLTHGGVTRAATAQLTVVAPPGPPAPPLPTSATVRGIHDGFAPASVTIAAGGTVTWTMEDEEHDVTWQGAAPPGGNIPRLDDDETASRTFPVAGTYTYRCMRHEDDGETGTVVVETPGGTGGGGTNPPPPPPPPASGATVTTPGASFSPATVTIAAGAAVTWQISGTRHNVTFSQGAPTGGNIPDTENASVSRTFPVAGTFPYACTRHNGMTGTVVVQ